MLNTILKTELVYKILILFHGLPKGSPWFRLRERAHTIRLKKRGSGGYLQDTKIKYPDRLEIGTEVNFGGAVYLDAYGSISFGDYCLVGYGCTFTSSTHNTKAQRFCEDTLQDAIKIGSNVWFGVNCTILPGVEIPDNCIIAAGSVVTKKFTEKDIIIGGIPAKKLKNRFE